MGDGTETERIIHGLGKTPDLFCQHTRLAGVGREPQVHQSAIRKATPDSQRVLEQLRCIKMRKLEAAIPEALRHRLATG